MPGCEARLTPDEVWIGTSLLWAVYQTLSFWLHETNGLECTNTAALSFTSTHIVQLDNYKVYVDMLLTLT